MGKRAEKERREAAAAKKRGTSVTANSTSTSTTQSGRSSGANAATASSVKGQKSTRTSAQAKPTTRSTRSSPHASQVTSSGSRVQVVAVSGLGPNAMDVDHSSEGRPVRSKAAAAVRDLVEQVKTLDGDSDSSSDSDSSGIEIVDEDRIDEADLDTGIEDYEEDEMFSYTDNRWTIVETAGSKPKAGKGSAAIVVASIAAKTSETCTKTNQKGQR